MNKTAKEITLKAKKAVFSILSGYHISKLLGEGYDFAELREYSYGDDVKKIDWKTTAKLNKPYIKVYHEEKQLNVVVSTMLNGSTYFGLTKLKKDFIIEILALLGYSAIKSKDLFSHILFANKMYHHSTPTKKIYGVNKEIEYAIEFDPIGKAANYEAWIEVLNKRISKKSLLFLIADFISDDINLSLLAKKHDLFVIIVRDEFLENPKPLGEVTLVDPDYLNSFNGNVDENTIKEYKKAVLKNDKKLIKHLKKSGIRYFKIYTYQNPYLELLKRMR